jgi:hypothetical protein
LPRSVFFILKVDFVMRAITKGLILGSTTSTQSNANYI